MKITCTELGGAAIITFEGDLLIDGVADAKPELVAAMGASKDIRLDLGGIRACDTAGLQLLLLARASARARGAKIQLIARPASFNTAADRIGIPSGAFDL